MKNKLMIFSTIILFALMISLVSAGTTYTPSTDTTCVQGAEGLLCNKVLYSGTRNVYEDNQWKKVEDAKSLKDKGFKIVVLEDDKEFPIEVVDFNMTSIKVKLNPKGIKVFNEDIPIRVWEVKDEQSDIKDFKNTYEKQKDEKIKFNLLNQEEEITYDFGLGKILEFGYNSTTIKLQEADTENLGDTYVKNETNVNYGTLIYFHMGTSPTGFYRSYITFNISSIPSGTSIISSTLYLRTGSTLDTYNVGVHHVYNLINGTGSNYLNETTLTGFNQPCGNLYTMTNNTNCNLTQEDNVLITNSETFYPFSVTNSVKKSILDNQKNVSFVMNTTSGSFAGQYFFSKEYATESKRPYLNITYVSPLAINITYPTNTTYTTIPTTLNWTIGGDIEEACWYSDDIGVTNTSVTCTDLSTSITPGQGSNTYYMWANDSSNNIVSDNVTFYIDSLNPNINLTYPTNTTYSNVVIALNYTASDVNLQSCWYSLDSGITNTSVTCGDNVTGLNSGTGSNTWTVYANDTFNNFNLSSVTFYVNDFSINITNPINGTTALGYKYLNWTSGVDNADCWYSLNSGVTNTSVTCTDLSKSLSGLIGNGTYTLNMWANDSLGTEETSNTTFTRIVFLENNQTANASTYETLTETFTLNISFDSSEFTTSSAVLNFNGTNYAGTKTGSGDTLLFTRVLNIPAKTGNMSYFWNVTLNNGTNNYFNSTTKYQDVYQILFGLCNATLTSPYLNLTFKDESTDAYMDAHITSSSFEYYAGNGNIKKLYEYSNTIDTASYGFCFSPTNKTVYVDPYVQYKESVYSQRVWNPAVTTLTNTTTNQILYLLGSGSGNKVTLQTVTTSNQIISGVFVNVNRIIDGNASEVASGTTDSAGLLTLFLNPDYVHTLSFVKDGYSDVTISITPSQSSYTITMGAITTETPSKIKGVDYTITPRNTSLVNDTSYNFGFLLTSSYWDLEEYGFNLRLRNGSIISGGTTVVSGTQLTKAYNTNNQTRIYLDYYWVIDSNYTNGTVFWNVYQTDDTQWSISQLVGNFKRYINLGMFGLNDFGRLLIVFVVLFISVGIMSYKYGLTSPLSVSSLTFAIIFFLDITLGLIPDLVGVKHLLTFVSGSILVLLIFNEVKQ